MNPTTQQVIEFLTHPELPFGTEEDTLTLGDPIELQGRVTSLLEEFPLVLGKEHSTSLYGRLGEADWPFIAKEFQARIALASSFFDPDAQASQATE
jgi:hypothetical protein